jgi:hypothetical protein
MNYVVEATVELAIDDSHDLGWHTRLRRGIQDRFPSAPEVEIDHTDTGAERLRVVYRSPANSQVEAFNHMVSTLNRALDELDMPSGFARMWVTCCVGRP